MDSFLTFVHLSVVYTENVYQISFQDCYMLNAEVILSYKDMFYFSRPCENVDSVLS